MLRAPFVAEFADVQSDTESREEACAINTAPADDEGQFVYCEDCKQWFNGPRQYEDHKIGKKHKKNYRKQTEPDRRVLGEARAASRAQGSADPPPPIPPHPAFPEAAAPPWTLANAGFLFAPVWTNPLTGAQALMPSNLHFFQ